MLESYRHMQARLLNVLEDMRSLKRDNLDDALVGRADELAEKIRQSAFYLVVLGEFKRFRKSSKRSEETAKKTAITSKPKSSGSWTGWTGN